MGRMPRIVRFLVTLVGVALASYAYLYWQTPGVGLSLALPAPAWWPFEHNAVWRSITWSQFAHTAVLAVVSIPMACAIQVFVPRLQVIQLVDAAKLVTMLPLVVWLLGLGRRAAA